MAQGSNIGMMEGAFFVPRGELLEWINNLLQLNVQKIEQLASGAAYCSVVDAVFPGTVSMSRVNWMARNDFEFVANYKILQQAFEKNGVEKWIDVDKLIRGKYQDNLEFVQWLKKFFDLNGGQGKEYDALARRRNVPTPWDGTAPSQPRRAAAESSAPARPRPAKKAPSATKDVALVREKDFYYSKLRAIELYCQHYEGTNDPHLVEISKVLYATEDDTVEVTAEGTIQVTKVEGD